jgi:DNA invertase Pin-like site-specific DNA recombinase
MLAVFAKFARDILRDRVKSRIAQARKKGRPHRPPPSVQHHAPSISVIFKQGISKRQIAARLNISRASFVRLSPARRGTALRKTAAA